MKYWYLSLLLFLGSAWSMSAQVFDYVVAKDGTGTHTTIQAAIDACPDKVHKYILIKNGTYEEKVMIGSHSKTSNKLLSIIGESVEHVIITWNDYNGKTITYDGRETKSGTPQSATMTVNAVDFYMENVTVKNTYTAAQAVAFYNVADRQTFKNCRLIGYQDTHYLKKGRRYYFLDCYIEGATDYICAGGTAIFDNCTLHSIKNGSYITAPEDITATKTVDGKKYYYGFIFRNCTLTSPSGVEVFLGRPWQGTSSSIFLSCKMQNIKSAGWSTWTGDNHKTSFFAEYNSMDLEGNPINVSNRVDWSCQLTANEVETLYTDEIIYSFSTTPYNPIALMKTPDSPTGLAIQGNILTWSQQDNVKKYLVYKDGVYQATVTTNQYELGDPGTYSVVAVGVNAQPSEAYSHVHWYGTNLSIILSEQILYYNNILSLPVNSEVELYSTSGVLVTRYQNTNQVSLSDLTPGVYLAKVLIEGSTYTKKVQVK